MDPRKEIERLKEQERKQKAELEILRVKEQRRQTEQAITDQREKERRQRKESERKAHEDQRKRDEDDLQKRRWEGHVGRRENDGEHTKERNLVSPATLHGSHSSRKPSSRPRSPSKSPVRSIKHSRLEIPEEAERQAEQEALELLLQEGRELAARSAPPRDVEHSESLDPPSSTRKSALLRQPPSHPSPRRPPADEIPDRPRALRAGIEDSKRRSRASSSFNHAHQSCSRSPERASKNYQFQDEQSKDAWKASTRADRERDALE